MPLVDMHHDAAAAGVDANLAAFHFGFGLFAAFVLIPQFAEPPASTGFGFGASVTEVVSSCSRECSAMLVAGPISGRLSSTVGSKVPLLARRARLVRSRSSSSRSRTPTAGRSMSRCSSMGVGIGFAFASMANLIAESVDVTQTGVATGLNTIVRSIGGAIESQLSAGIVTATVASTGLPTERGFTIAFASCAVALAVAFVVALRIPAPVARRERARRWRAAGRADATPPQTGPARPADLRRADARLLLAALDQTIVSTALPTIVGDLGGLDTCPGS